MVRARQGSKEQSCVHFRQETGLVASRARSQVAGRSQAAHHDVAEARSQRQVGVVLGPAAARQQPQVQPLGALTAIRGGLVYPFSTLARTAAPNARPRCTTAPQYVLHGEIAIERECVQVTIAEVADQYKCCKFRGVSCLSNTGCKVYRP